MDCNEVEDLLVPYLLGSLDDAERRRVDEHLETCEACSLRLQGDGEAVSRLAFTVPQLEVSASVKQQLMARIDADEQATAREQAVSLPRRPRFAFSGLFFGYAGAAVAAVFVIGLVFGGIWFNGRMSDISSDNAELSGQVQDVIEREAQVRKMLSDQRHLTSMTAAPGVSVNMLWGTDKSARAWGMIACCAVANGGTVAVLAASNLRPLPVDQVYQVWLLRNNKVYSAGVFNVDSTGYGQAVIIPPVLPFREIEGVIITVEPSGGSADPTGSDVLKGDL